MALAWGSVFSALEVVPLVLLVILLTLIALLRAIVAPLLLVAQLMVILDITAVAGAGNLLGNLLCALVGILDQSPINLTLLDSLLAQINAILGSL